MSEFISRRPERQFGESEGPSRARNTLKRDGISRIREQPSAGDPKPESRGYQMGEPMKESQQG